MTERRKNKRSVKGKWGGGEERDRLPQGMVKEWVVRPSLSLSLSVGLLGKRECLRQVALTTAIIKENLALLSSLLFSSFLSKRKRLGRPRDARPPPLSFLHLDGRISPTLFSSFSTPHSFFSSSFVVDSKLPREFSWRR